VAPGAGGVVGAEGRVGAVGAQQRGHLDHRPAAASPAPAGRRRRPGRRADVAQRVAILAVERRPVPRRHGGGHEAEAELELGRVRSRRRRRRREELELVRDRTDETPAVGGVGTSPPRKQRTHTGRAGPFGPVDWAEMGYQGMFLVRTHQRKALIS
jgi:hypothetical protein